jgi:hypothetical protein
MEPMRFALAVVAFAFGLLVSCGSAYPQTEIDQVRGAARQETTRRYFPVGVFGQDAYKERWYASLLAAMQEPSLFENRTGEITAYRLLLGLKDRALSFRPELLVDGTGELSVARVILRSGKPESVLLKDRVPISAERVDEFLTLLQKADFWNSATEEKRDKDRLLKEIHWVLEGVKNREYLVVDRVSPKGNDFGRSCIFLMALTPMNPDERGEKLSPSTPYSPTGH